jgi:hypothetical protein
MTKKHGASEAAGTVSLADEEEVKKVLVGSIMGLWEVVNSLTRLRPSRKDRYRVSIFGSARVPKGSWVYEEVAGLSRALTDLGCDIVTGGGPGLMEAANEGASRARARGRGRSMGVGIELPFEQSLNPFVEQAFEHRTFFTRLHQFVLMSDAFVVVPGGVGTALELLMVWQLLQVQHIEERTPLILVGKMYADLVEWARRSMLDPRFPLASPGDMDIPLCVDTAGEAIDAIRAHQASWRKARRRPRREGRP